MADFVPLPGRMIMTARTTTGELVEVQADSSGVLAVSGGGGGGGGGVIAAPTASPNLQISLLPPSPTPVVSAQPNGGTP